MDGFIIISLYLLQYPFGESVTGDSGGLLHDKRPLQGHRVRAGGGGQRDRAPRQGHQKTGARGRQQRSGFNSVLHLAALRRMYAGGQGGG